MARLNLHITEDIDQRLKAHCKRTGANKSEVVRRALTKYLEEVK